MRLNIVTRGLGILVVLALALLVAWSAIAGPGTVLRILQYGDTDIDDFSHYPGRKITASEGPFVFDQMGQEVSLTVADLSSYGDEDLETLLEANDTIAFLMVKNDAILYERYFQGHSASSLSQIFSVTKSVTSALVGMAIEDGYFASVHQPIVDHIPELAGQGFEEVTFHHLLTMTSGSSYQENDNPFGEHVILNYTLRLEKEILEFDTEAAPGTVFRYKSGDNALLGLALARTLAPESITAYTQRRLWEPLGMQDSSVWTIDHQGDGLEKTWCCLALTARDLAKVGRLYLNQGTWDGMEILPSSWVEASTGRGQVDEEQWPDTYREAGWRNYGYQWWLASEEDGDYFGLGKDGQFLYVNPSRDVVIVRLGWSSGELLTSQWISLFQTLSHASP